SDPAMIRRIQEAVTIPVMAKARIGHFAEAQVLEALEVDYIDESEVLTPADEANHIDKWAFMVPFVCGATSLGEALRRIGEGAEGVFVGSGIFKSEDPERRARAIVEATTHYRDPARVAAASTGLGQPMVSLETSKLEEEQLLAPRGW